ncbi:MAG: sugar phosphate isomerase/epimerase [Candidatus Pacearchaeota archaeon]|nr:sugar phosphate isomerase/epimerase [Candidatus Pacearchaeota archaeon]
MGSGNFYYKGSDNGLNPEYYEPTGYETSAFSIATDPRTANQLKATIEKLHTGAKAVEVSIVDPRVFEAIPKQHFEELRRLKELAGAELTLHAPIIEPTGVTRQGWDPSHREQAERQMWNAIEKARELDKEGNVIVTFHSSASLPEAETKVIEDGKEKIKEFMVVNERDGHFERVQFKPSYFLKEEQKVISPEDQIKRINEESWTNSLHHMGYAATLGSNQIENIQKKLKEKMSDKEISKVLEMFDKYSRGEGIEELKSHLPQEQIAEVEDLMDSFTHAHINLRNAYSSLQGLFNQAYIASKGEDKEKLDRFREEISRDINEISKDYSKINKLSEIVKKGIHILHGIQTPQIIKPLKDFAIDKASETFANIAFQSYNQFGDKSPIISIENPPAGTTGISRADELNKLIEVTRDKFVKKAIVEKGLSEEEAKRYAEKIIGATWDVGHINMLRKLGYQEKEIIGESKKIAPKVKHVHLSDNFGLEHTELPMGMGNVPNKEILDAISKYNKQVKKVIEVGDWYQFFQSTPFREVLSHFNSPIYAMKNMPYWTAQGLTQGAYFAGYGLPGTETHASYFGAGFSNLPVELGGQQSGRSRLSGAPIE